ncbi:hypothetical protein AB205_0120620, partial [Aquarana catesbeiana]
NQLCLRHVLSLCPEKEEYTRKKDGAEFHPCAVYIKHNTRAAYVRSVSGVCRIISADNLNEGKSQPGGGHGKQPDGIPGPSPPPSNQKHKEGRNLEESAAAFLKQANVVLNTTPGGHKAFGCVTASKLEHMEEGQCTICEEIILKALNKGMRGKLTTQTHLCESDHTPPPPPATPPIPQPTTASWKEAWKEVLRLMAWVWCGLAKNTGCRKTTASGHICHLLLLPISRSHGPYCAPN